MGEVKLVFNSNSLLNKYSPIFRGRELVVYQFFNFDSKAKTNTNGANTCVSKDYLRRLRKSFLKSFHNYKFFWRVNSYVSGHKSEVSMKVSPKRNLGRRITLSAVKCSTLFAMQPG